jgi:hypothetical protein
MTIAQIKVHVARHGAALARPRARRIQSKHASTGPMDSREE